jgi:hypothetical protein
MKTTAKPIPFAGSTLGRYRHICAFFSSPEEEYEIMLPFVRDGIDRGERVYHCLPAQYRQEHLEQLRSAGIDVTAALKSHQLEVASPEEVYLRGGGFSKDAMLATAQEVLKAGPTLGFPLTRLIAHAEAVLQGGSKANEWVEYETRLNELLPRYDDPVVCTYDSNLLDGTMLVDILRIHPMVIIGGRLYENPFFVPPGEFLRQIIERSGKSTKPYRAP